MRRYYDIDICKAVGNPENEDYESIYTEAADTKAEAIKIAKKYSMLDQWGETPIFEVHVVCYIHSTETDYEPLYIRAYRKGEFVDEF